MNGDVGNNLVALHFYEKARHEPSAAYYANAKMLLRKEDYCIHIIPNMEGGKVSMKVLSGLQDSDVHPMALDDQFVQYLSRFLWSPSPSPVHEQHPPFLKRTLPVTTDASARKGVHILNGLDLTLDWKNSQASLERLLPAFYAALLCDSTQPRVSRRSSRRRTQRTFYSDLVQRAVRTRTSSADEGEMGAFDEGSSALSCPACFASDPIPIGDTSQLHLDRDLDNIA